MSHNRREFLRRTGCAALGAAAFSAGFKRLGLMNLYAQEAVGQSRAATPGYQALVCIFLFGGNDASNMVVPIDATGYGAYNAIRGPSGLGLAQGTLLPIAPASFGATPSFGLHPNLVELQGLFGSGKLSVVCNVGPLVEPLTRTTYRNGTGRRPYQLFSHDDQQLVWQSSRADTRVGYGFGGLIADKVLPLNSGSGFPVVTSVSGAAVFGQGLSTRPLTISSGAALNQVLVLNGFTAAPESVERRNQFDYLRTIDRAATLVAAASDGTQEALDIASSITADPTLTTVFPNSSLGQQLKQIAKVIKLNQTSTQLRLNRQIFFASIGGFDTHQNQLGAHTNLYTDLSRAMNAFYNATVELGLSDRVTTFTLSDFGRTLQPSGTGGASGTDHGWGSHHLVMGGGVKGGDFYGVTQSGCNGTVFPVLALGGCQDTDTRGRFIPTCASDQYGATLAKWFGVQAADLSYVFPLLGNFAASDLGFMF